MGTVVRLFEVEPGQQIVQRGRRWTVSHKGRGRGGNVVVVAHRGPENDRDELVLERFPGFEIEVCG